MNNIRAFPTGTNVTSSLGMTLRDYFAAKAMQAMLSSPNCPMELSEDSLAEEAYMTADAMLNARN
jgi:hypothetical protein